MNSSECTVLKMLANEFSDDFGCLPFKPISNRTGLDVKVVRRACRSLTRKGLAAYERGLWTEDGQPAGSGYRATRDGVEYAEARRNMK